MWAVHSTCGPGTRSFSFFSRNRSCLASSMAARSFSTEAKSSLWTCQYGASVLQVLQVLQVLLQALQALRAQPLHLPALAPSVLCSELLVTLIVPVAVWRRHS